MIVDIFKLKEQDIIAYNLVKASWLQKAVRRGDAETAKAIGQLYLDDNQEQGLYRKLLIFITEDIGIATPQAILLIKDKPILDQIEILAKCNKNRECDRFLLIVKDNYKYLIEDSDIDMVNEVKKLNELLIIADEYYSNKNKINKQKIIDYVNNLIIDKTDFIKEIAKITLDNYFFLTKHNSFGARTCLAFLILLIERNIESSNQNIIIENIKPRTILNVDDYALDKHTPYGKILNRGEDFWLKEGSIVFPELNYSSMYKKDKKEKYPYVYDFSKNFKFNLNSFLKKN